MVLREEHSTPQLDLDGLRLHARYEPHCHRYVSSLLCEGLLLTPSYLSGLLAYRIWSISAQTYRNFDSTYRRSPLRPILFVIIESGMIYSAMLTIALITVIHAPAVEWVVNGVVRPTRISLTSYRTDVRHR